MSIRFDWKPKLDEDGTIRFTPQRDRVAELLRKHGEGSHDDKDHGNWADGMMHSGEMIPAASGSATREGVSHDVFLVDSSGNPISNSFEALSDVYAQIGDSIEALPATIQQDILATLTDFDLTPEKIQSNVEYVFERALQRYADNPELIDEDRFYQGWHTALSLVSERTGIDLTRVIAAAAVISPGLNAPHNLHFANDLATWVSANEGRGVIWEGGDAQEILAALDEAQRGILQPVYKDKHKAVTSGKANVGDPMPPPKPGSFRYQQGQAVLADLERLRSSGSFSVSDLSPLSAAYALHYHRAKAGGLDVEAEGFLRGKKPNKGFSVKNFQYYADAIAVLRGEATPSQVLGDVKVRSFHNNILDPLDAAGRGDVTVDFHTINLAALALGADKKFSKPMTSTPSLQGVQLGARPLIADAIRKIASSRTLNGERLSPARVQEILWAEWKRGLVTKGDADSALVPEWAAGSKDNTIVGWTPYGETMRSLPLLMKGEDGGDDESDDE